eukprot:1576321-Alexandrium_andersonii.AAC.1
MPASTRRLQEVRGELANLAGSCSKQNKKLKKGRPEPRSPAWLRVRRRELVLQGRRLSRSSS